MRIPWSESRSSPRFSRRAQSAGWRRWRPLIVLLGVAVVCQLGLAGNAAISVPCGLADEDGLPVGLQVMAPPLGDDRLYRVGAAVEAAFTSRWGHPLLTEAKGLISS